MRLVISKVSHFVILVKWMTVNLWHGTHLRILYILNYFFKSEFKHEPN